MSQHEPVSNEELARLKLVNTNAFNIHNVSILSNSIVYDDYSENKVIAYERYSQQTRKVYVTLNASLGGEYRSTLALLDCGADACIIRYDVLRKMFPNVKKLNNRIRKTNVIITGFAGVRSSCMGIITLSVKFTPQSKPIPVHFYVINTENKNTTLAIIGISSFTYMKIQLSFYQTGKKYTPVVSRILRSHTEYLDAHYLSEHDIQNVQKRLLIAPREMSHVKLEVGPHMAYDEDDVFIVQGADNVNNVIVHTAASMVEEIDGKHYVRAAVENYSDTPFDGDIDFHIEVKNPDDKILPSIKGNISEIAACKVLHDIVVLDSEDSVNPNIEINSTKEMETVELDDCNIHTVKIEPYSEPTTTINTVTVPSFPKKNVGFNPTAINNDCAEGEALSDSLMKEKLKISKCDEKRDFSDKNTIQAGIQSPDPMAEREMAGFELPTPGYDKIGPADVIKLENYPAEIRPYLKDIFIDKYSDTVSCHSLDIGNLSYYLGYYTLKLKKGAKLPKYSKIYYLSPSDSKHMRDILTFLEGQDIISKAPQGGDAVPMCCSSYLIARRDKQAVARMIVNYIPLNRITDCEAPVIPTTVDILGKLRDSSYFTSLDFTGAFNSIYLHPSCRHLTSFITPHGTYYSNRLITGGIASPGALHRFMDRLLNYKPKRDKNGNVLWDAESLAALTWDPIEQCHIYFDDLIIYTPFVKSHEHSRDIHFKVVEKVIARISLYKGKISLKKSNFFRNKITFLGWNISYNYIYPDKKRIEKVLNFPIPDSVKKWRSFVGVVNSLRLVLGFTCLKNISVLSELTSEKANHASPTKRQIDAFNDIKKKLTSAPIFASLIDGNAPKILYTDAASSVNGSVGAVLGQLSAPRKKTEYQPKYLHMGDVCHRLIHKHDLPCVPVRTMRRNEEVKSYVKSVGPSFPPETDYLEEEKFGYYEEISNSLELCLRSLFALHNMSLTEDRLAAIGKDCNKFMRSEVTGQQVKTFFCEGSHDKYQTYLANLKEFKFVIDPELCIFDCLSVALSRPFVIVSSLDIHKDDPIHHFRTDLTRPPFFILLYKIGDEIVAKAAYIDKDQTHSMESMRGSFEIVAYYAHTLPKALMSVHVMEVEALAIMMSLEAFEKLIGFSECILCCDSKALFYLFNREIQSSSEKVTRWAGKIFAKFPNLKVTFVKSADNLADLFTRHFNVKPPQFRMTGVERLGTCVSDALLEDVNMRTFTLDQWRLYVESHPEFLIKPENSAVKQNVKNKKKANKSDSCTKTLRNEDETVTNAVRSDTNTMRTQHDRVTNIMRVNTKFPFDETKQLTPNDLFINEIKVNILNASQHPTFQESISNYVNITETIELIKPRFDHNQIQSHQRIQFSELYDEIVTSPDMSLEKDDAMYSIVNGVIFRKVANNISQIMLPNELLDIVVAYHHIKSNHGGITRLSNMLSPFYAKGMKKKITDFCRTCLTCTLNNFNTSVPQFGTFPVTNKPFASVHIDFLENLKPCEGYKYLLVIIDSFSLISFCIPFKTQTSKEFLTKFIYHVVQVYKPTVLACDNSLTFMKESTLRTLASFGVRVIQTAPNLGYNKGFQESYVKIYKTCLRKYTTSDETESWLFLPVLISNHLNSSISPRHGQKPLEMMFGKSRMTESLEDNIRGETQLHPLISKDQTQVDELSEKWLNHLTKIQEEMNKDKIELNETLNKTRHKKEFPPNSVVFIKRPAPDQLETVYIKSIYKILDERKTSCICIRMSDGKISLVHKANIKIYEPDNHLFSTLPQAIREICLHLQSESALSKDRLEDLMNYEDFTIPQPIIDLVGENPQTILSKEFGPVQDSQNQAGPSRQN